MAALGGLAILPPERPPSTVIVSRTATGRKTRNSRKRDGLFVTGTDFAILEDYGTSFALCARGTNLPRRLRFRRSSRRGARAGHGDRGARRAVGRARQLRSRSLVGPIADREQESARFDCDSISLSVSDPGSETAAAPNWRARLGTSLEAHAARGRIEQDSSATLVRLRDGFTLQLGTGWKARGAAMTWDGERVVTDSAVRLERPGISIMAARAVIVPSRNRIALDQAEGTVDGVAL
jgi:hypothetical protein